MFRNITILILLFIFGTGGPVFAGFRCGPKLVTSGDTKVEVIGKCGEPTFAEITAVVSEGRYGSHLTYENRRDRVSQTIEISSK